MADTVKQEFNQEFIEERMREHREMQQEAERFLENYDAWQPLDRLRVVNGASK